MMQKASDIYIQEYTPDFVATLILGVWLCALQHNQRTKELNHVFCECPYAPTIRRTLCSLFLLYGVLCEIHVPGLLTTLLLWNIYVTQVWLWQTIVATYLPVRYINNRRLQNIMGIGVVLSWVPSTLHCGTERSWL